MLSRAAIELFIVIAFVHLIDQYACTMHRNSHLFKYQLFDVHFTQKYLCQGSDRGETAINQSLISLSKQQ